jgi:hypothetical protein
MSFQAGAVPTLGGFSKYAYFAFDQRFAVRILGV